jgi:uncharacterized protein YprB with RNaseH-like and TPR domain
MDLSEKLRQFREKIVTAPKEQKQDRYGGYPEIHDVIPGEYVETPFGPCFVTESCYPFLYYHGNSTLDMEFTGCSNVLSNLGLTGLKEAPSFIFLDTETSGLSHGTGTYVFLVGIGQYSKDTFTVKQYFMKDLPEEISLLFLVNEVLNQGGIFVTYNGKCFDIPLLQTRFVYSSMPTRIETLPHLDLLHFSRRIWKDRIGSCSLSNVESQILGVRRIGDVPGSLIPSIYFEYLRTRNAQILQPVFYHNCQDILSLAALLNHVVRLMNIAYCSETHQEPGDIYGVGKIYESLGELNAAEICYTLVIANGHTKYEKQNALWSLSMLMKRQQRMEEAAMLWKQLVDIGTYVGIAPYIELAKYYEHKVKDYVTARHFVNEAMKVMDKKSFLLKEGSGIFIQELTALRHRLGRLMRKLSSVEDSVRDESGQ